MPPSRTRSGVSSTAPYSIKPMLNISKTIERLTSNKKRLSDEKLSTNKTIEFFSEIKNKRLRSSPLKENPNFSIYNTYCPYDKARLLRRIHSYGVLNWTIDDDRLTPLECARYGWICFPAVNGKNHLRCVTCNSSLIIKLNEQAIDDDDDDNDDNDREEKFSEELNAKLISSYLDKLSTDHTENCPWSINPTPYSTYAISSYDYQEVLTKLGETIQELNSNKDKLKGNFKKILNFEELKILKDWTNNEYEDKILNIALLGWKLKIQEFGTKKIIFLQCNTCNRRILLDDNHHIEISSDIDKEEIDLCGEHKQWCAIKNGYKSILALI
ncbi:hypothetical protein PACTADRAFT_792 [Pachysolen tannophilus NRRL Y-2460]|uniref:C3HC-type domain-containing protein n=1 Tax=Pachysolen tannophilus NRRL Y-2460 TaxID=669874 RepID=A0A1E4U2T7_PACTA|nr:hypothetical protein PACTADRAFT_792 [Pachysolen tannophilus NRRL Y-2460]